MPIGLRKWIYWCGKEIKTIFSLVYNKSGSGGVIFKIGCIKRQTLKVSQNLLNTILTRLDWF